MNIVDEPVVEALPETQGSGVFHFPDGSQYDGDYQSFNQVVMRHGRGTFINGPEKYNGSWHKDQMEGKGSFVNGNAYCQGATIMYDGFQSAFHGICPRLLFHGWVLNSEAKYALGFIGIVLMGILLEWWGEFQDQLHRRLLRTLVVPPSPDTSTAHEDPDLDIELSLEDTLLPADQRAQRRRSLPFSARAVLAASYMGMMALAYFIMLVVMSYESGFFVAAVLGMGLGFFFFRDVDALHPSGNPDPCCST
ncbi:hypothetical protein DYB30_010984 [Aphanomyces astaci]|uniref:Copper transport protein n=1 Tax=Aphanomyces astaci TaxID=112090 RepID=A0A397CTV0_APHAT|nr:hypothetical protein DYB30_010984 [Aphanomyces astaci]